EEVGGLIRRGPAGVSVGGERAATVGCNASPPVQHSGSGSAATGPMRRLERLGKLIAILGAFTLSGFLAHQFGSGGLWHGFDSALAVAKPGQDPNYDLTR